jgi:hypothetical protein
MSAPFQVIKKQHKRAATLTHNELVIPLHAWRPVKARVGRMAKSLRFY